MRGKGIAMGHSEPRTCSGWKTLKRCKNKEEADNVVLIDLDSDSFNNVIIIDFPEYLPKKRRVLSSSAMRTDKKCPLRTVICIDDDESTDSSHPGIDLKGYGDLYCDSSSSTRSCPASSHTHNSVDEVGDECQFVQENTCPLKLSKCKRTYSGKASTKNRYGLSTKSESGSSEDDGPDCEFMEDSFGKLRKQWEMASLKRKNDVSNGQSGMGDHATASRFFTDTFQDIGVENKTERHIEATVSPNSSKAKDLSPSIATVNCNLGSTSRNPEQAPFADTVLKSMHSTQFHRNEADVHARGETFTEDPSCNYAEGEALRHLEHGGSSFRNEEERSPQEPPLYPSHKFCNKQVNHVENISHDKEKMPESEPSLLGSDSRGGINFCHSNASLPDGDASFFKGQDSVETEVDHLRLVCRHVDEKLQKAPSCHTHFPNESERGTSLKENEKSVSRESSFHNTQPSDETQVDHVAASNEKVGAVPEVTFSCRSQSLGMSEVGIENDYHQEKGEPSFCTIRLNEVQLKEGKSCLLGGNKVSYGSLSNSQQGDEKYNLLDGEDGDAMPVIRSSIIDEREKLKETDGYKRAFEEEWASRQRELKIQAEEAQELRRLRKRKKAESMRLLDMERRQKKRLEEMRENQKKDEENMNLKELHRAEVRKELSKLEVTCHDMASLLRGLGIHTSGALHPLSHEVRAAYKRALLIFHPDRTSGSDIRQQVEAEEKFKLISRMKDKFLSTS